MPKKTPGIVLVLSAFLPWPLLAQEQAAPKPAPAAQDPQTTTPSEFARFVREGDGGHLDTAITTYRNQEGVEVTMYGALHIADTAHYQELQRRFAAHDALLYELVGPENYRPRPGQRTSGMVSLLQRALKTGLQLDFQLDAIDYRQDNFVHADMTPEEFREAQTEAGESLLGLMWQGMMKEMQRIREGGEVDPAMQQFAEMDLVTAFRNNEGRHLLRMVFAAQLQSVEKAAAGFSPDGKPSVLVEGRNEKCLQVLAREMKGGRKKLGIYYGAAHLPHLEQRLVKDLGFHKVKHEWLQAWDCTKRPDKPAAPGGATTAADGQAVGLAERVEQMAADAKAAKTRADLKVIADTVKLKMLMGGAKELPTMQVLRTRDADGRLWLDSDGKDPWGSDYLIRGRRPGAFEVRSAGPDRKMDTGDDLVQPSGGGG